MKLSISNNFSTLLKGLIILLLVVVSIDASQIDRLLDDEIMALHYLILSMFYLLQMVLSQTLGVQRKAVEIVTIESQKNVNLAK